MFADIEHPYWDMRTQSLYWHLVDALIGYFYNPSGLAAAKITYIDKEIDFRRKINEENPQSFVFEQDGQANNS
jgi:hypothetical protein